MTLLLGGSGQLGTAFRKLLPDAVAPTHHQLDVADTPALISYLDAVSPPRIVNCAGFTDVDGAEDNEVQAMSVNASAVGELARAANQRQIPFVTFSSDYVFDGHSAEPYVESSTTNPLNAYGRSKEAGERLALRYGGSLVIRTSWLFSSTHDNFVASILRAAASGRQLRVVADQFGRPTYSEDLAVATLEAADRGVTGLLHLASPPAVSWHQFAQAAIEEAGLEPALVEPCLTGQYPSKAHRPHWSVLGSEVLPDFEGLALGPWTSRLRRTAAGLMRADPQAQR